MRLKITVSLAPLAHVATVHHTRQFCEHVAFVGAACDLAGFWHVLHFLEHFGQIGAVCGCVAAYLTHVEERRHRETIADHIDRVVGATSAPDTPPQVPNHYRTGKEI